MLGCCQLLCGWNGSQAAVFGDKHSAAAPAKVGLSWDRTAAARTLLSTPESTLPQNDQCILLIILRCVRRGRPRSAEWCGHCLPPIVHSMHHRPAATVATTNTWPAPKMRGPTSPPPPPRPFPSDKLPVA